MLSLTDFLGRMNPFTAIRKRLLEKQRPFMRIWNDSFYESMNEHDLLTELRRIDDDTKFKSHEEAILYLKNLQRRRNLANWHDTSCISNHSHLLVMLICLYDTAIFYTDSEYFELTGKFPYVSN